VSMSVAKALVGIGCALFLAGAIYAFQRPFREYPSVEYGYMQLPPDWKEKGEWTFARLMYPPGPNDGYRGRFDGDWRLGLSLWTQDFPRADRNLAQAVRRLTRIQARSVEQCVNLEDGDEVFNWPWLYAVQTGEWGLTPAEGKVLREYLLRGGFFMADDFHGTEEWEVFEQSMKLVFPDRPIVEIPNSDPIFHTIFDLDDRFQIVGAEHLLEGSKNGGKVAHWRGIYDDKGRIMVAITFNSDVGDSWEWAGDPRYPQKYSEMGMRLGVNYIIYAMTH